MVLPTFLKIPSPLTLADVAALTGAQLSDPARASQIVTGGAALDRAGPRHLVFCEHKKYAESLAATQGGACLVTERLVASVPASAAILISKSPYRAFVTVLRELYRDALRPASEFGMEDVSPSAVVHPTARLEDGVIVDPLAVIGPDVEIGSGTLIGAGAIIGANVRIGRDCSIGPGNSIMFALIGNGVIVHPGCRIGQDGFGYLPGAKGHQKIPQAGRVVIQNDVEIGAGTTIDRGALNDTVIGEGSKIDNLVQIGHNVTIGRNCIIVSQSGIAGSSIVGDGAVLGARIGVSDHAVIGEGAQLAARSSVVGEVPAGQVWGGSVARPIRQWMREMNTLERLARPGALEGLKAKAAPSGSDDEGQK